MKRAGACQARARLVADDVVEIRKISDTTLVGRSPDVIRHLMEIRGLGLVDVSVLYGMGAVMVDKTITLCVHLELGDVQDIDRLGIAEDHVRLLGIDVPKITIPVRPGRNIAIIMEVAAMNFPAPNLLGITLPICWIRKCWPCLARNTV